MARLTVATLREEMREELRIQQDNYQERIAELELAIEDRGWLSLAGANETEFTRAGLRKICHESFLFFLKNPLIRRAVETQADYVFAQGVTIKATHPTVDEVVQEFLDDKKNQAVFTTIVEMIETEQNLQIYANLFFVFFKNPRGDVRVRFIEFDQIEDTITNPEDASEVWFYVRKWTEKTGATIYTSTIRTELYPDWDYRPDDRQPEYDRKPIHWDEPVYHVKVNAVQGQKFGTSEIYAAQDWARAYNKFLENWSSLIASYARFAWDILRKGGSGARAATKTMLDSDISNDGYKPPPSVGSVAIHGPDDKISPIKTAGATTSMEDGRRLALMVFAAMGWPETFFGDVSVGSLATAKSLNRPVELKCMRRQRLWEIVIEEICAFAIQCAAEVGREGLSGEWVMEERGWEEEVFIYANDTANEDPEKKTEPIDTYVDVSFPDLVEQDVNERVKAIATAATLDGRPFAGTIDAEYTTEQMLHALGETSTEEAMERFFPENEEPEAVAVATAVQDLQGAIEALSAEREMDRGEVVKVLAETFVAAFKEAADG